MCRFVHKQMEKLMVKMVFVHKQMKKLLVKMIFVHKQMKKLLVKTLVSMRRFPKQPHPKSKKDRTRHDIDDKNNALIKNIAQP